MHLQEIVNRLQGVNHSEVAKRAGLTRSYVNAIANGVRLNPTVRTLQKINDALNAMEDKR